MCGIVGVIASKPTVKSRKIFRDMLFFDTVRGVHSTGLIVSDKNGYLDIFKKAMQASDFLQLKRTNNMIDDLTNQVLIGHNRHATVGQVNDINAHPFQFDNLAGMHNGTLTSRYNLDDSSKFSVDSENIFYHMQRNGSEDTIEKLDGAFTLVWVDAHKQTVHLARNSERPMWMASNKEKDMLFFASEPWMIRVACARHGVELEPMAELKEGVELVLDVNKFPAKESVEVLERKLRPKYNYNRGANASSYTKKSESGNAGNANSASASNNNVTPIKKGNSGAEKTFMPGQEVRFNYSSSRIQISQLNDERTYYITGFDTEGNYYNCMVDPITYQTIVKDSSKIQGIKAKFQYSKLPQAGTRDIPTHVLSGYKSISLLYPDYTTIIKDAGGNKQTSTINNKDTTKKIEALPVKREQVQGYKPDTVQGFNGRILSYTKYTEITSCGCANCSERVLFQDASQLMWLNHDSFYCPECKELELLGKLQ